MAEPITIAKALVTVVSSIKSYYDYLTQPDPDATELARRLGIVQQQIFAVRNEVAQVRQLLYRDAIVEIEAKVISAEEDFSIYLKGGNENYLISAKASALEAIRETQAKPYTWYSEIDTYLRAAAIRLKWFEVIEPKDPTLVEVRKAEMKGHAEHIRNLLSYLNTRCAGLVRLEEYIEWDVEVKPPVKTHYIIVYEMDEFGATRPGTHRNFGKAMSQAEDYRASLLNDLKNRVGMPNIQRVADICAAKS